MDQCLTMAQTSRLSGVNCCSSTRADFECGESGASQPVLKSHGWVDEERGLLPTSPNQYGDFQLVMGVPPKSGWFLREIPSVNG